jgi:hypothetical protein
MIMKKSVIEGNLAERRTPSRFGTLMSPIRFFKKGHNNPHFRITPDRSNCSKTEIAHLEMEWRSALAIGAWQRQSLSR